MQTVVISLMVLLLWSVMLKMTFFRQWSVWLVAFLSALLIGLSLSWAVGLSKTKIADWLATPDLMADTAVLLTVEVALQLSFCLMSLSRMTEFSTGRWRNLLFLLLSSFPGILYLIVLFSVLVTLVFALPGTSFSLIAWSWAAVILLLMPLLTWLFRKLIPSQEGRLELLFLVNVLIAVVGIIATVNGKTAVAGFGEVNWRNFTGLTLLLFITAIIGFGLYRLSCFRKEKYNHSTNK